MIEVHDLKMRYRETEALKGISFRVPRGEIIGLVGPNGAGKTTTMKVLTGYLVPTSGSASVAGVDVLDDPLSAQRMIGYLPESAPVYGDMLVQDYLHFIAALRGVPADRRNPRISEVVPQCGLEDRLTWPIGHLSKGFRQRVGLAEVMVHDPEVLILDEPTTGLDPNQIFGIRDLIRRMAHEKTVILSTHILSEVEATCTRAIIIIDGEIRADSDLAELQGTNATIVGLAGAPAEAPEALKSVEGVTGVERLQEENGVSRFRVSGTRDLAASMYELAKSRGYELVELHRDERRLEDVFRDLTRGR